MADFEVDIDLDGRRRPIGIARRNRVRGAETILFEYDGGWLEDADRFSLEPALALTRGTFAPPPGLATFGSIGESAPDTWGRRLMQQAERRAAEREKAPSRSMNDDALRPARGGGLSLKRGRGRASGHRVGSRADAPFRPRSRTSAWSQAFRPPAFTAHDEVIVASIRLGTLREGDTRALNCRLSTLLRPGLEIASVALLDLRMLSLLLLVSLAEMIEDQSWLASSEHAEAHPDAGIIPMPV
jgi:hypothetical protein